MSKYYLTYSPVTLGHIFYCFLFLFFFVCINYFTSRIGIGGPVLDVVNRTMTDVCEREHSRFYLVLFYLFKSEIKSDFKEVNL